MTSADGNSDQYQLWHYLLFITIDIICLINRYSHVPLTADITSELGFTMDQIGLLLTYFYAAYVFGCLCFGVLGDRYSRKKLIALDLFAEIVALLICTFFKSFYMITAGRIIMGFFQASFISIAPSVIADMYTDDGKRSIMTGIFCAAPALGIALGFGIGPLLAGLFGFNMVYLVYAVVTFILMVGVLFMPEYERGAGEKNKGNQIEMGETDETDKLKEENQLKIQGEKEPENQKSSITSDVGYLFANKTYMLVCVAFACTSGVTEIGMAFVNELLRKQFILVDQQEICIQDFTINNETLKEELVTNNQTCQNYITENLIIENSIKNYTEDQFFCGSCSSTASGISMTLGGVSVLGGIGGTLAGMILYNKFYEQSKRTSGCWASGLGCLLCALAVYILSLRAEQINTMFSWGIAVAMFFTISINFGVLTDVNNRVVVPKKRSLSNAGQNFIGRLLGGTIPPYLAGYMIESYQQNNIDDIQNEENIIKQLLDFLWMQYNATMEGLLLCVYFSFASGALWIAASFFWADDEDTKKKQSGEDDK